MNNGICYVSLYYDIGRNNWGGKFQRSFDDYLIYFEPFIKLFNKDTCEDDTMVVFIDKKFEEKLREKLNEDTKIQLIGIDNDFMNELPMWKTLEIERQNMKNLSFKFILGNRSRFPEHNYPEYTLINHCKIDIISYLINSNNVNYNYYAWVDFGFFGLKENIPEKLLDINRFNLDRINYTCINRIDIRDSDIIYTLQNAPEKVGGFFFFGQKDKLLEYQKLYHEILYLFQHVSKIADDDQHLVLQCFFKKPELFTMHILYGWHKVFKYYQKH
jgi:hypothetical protein